MSGTRPLRAVRIFQIVALLYNAGSFAYHAAIGSVFGMIAGAVCVVALAVAIGWTTGKIRQREYLNRPRPDYAAIAAMERELYGEAFEHEGAPEARRVVPPTMPPEPPLPRPQRKDYLRISGFRTECPEGHGEQLWVQGHGRMCPQCDERLEHLMREWRARG